MHRVARTAAALGLLTVASLPSFVANAQAAEAGAHPVLSDGTWQLTDLAFEKSADQGEAAKLDPNWTTFVASLPGVELRGTTDSPVERPAQTQAESVQLPISTAQEDRAIFVGNAVELHDIPVFVDSTTPSEFLRLVTWSGQNDADSAYASLVFVQDDTRWQLAAGKIVKDDAPPLLIRTAGGLVEMVEIINTLPDSEADAETAPEPRQSEMRTTLQTASAGVQRIDVLAVGLIKPGQGGSALSAGEVSSDILSQIADFNAAMDSTSSSSYVTSGVSAKLVGVFMHERAQTTAEDDRYWVNTNAAVDSIANAIGADAKAAVRKDNWSTSSCGVAYIGGEALVYRIGGTCEPYTFAHELGHVIGLLHSDGYYSQYANRRTIMVPNTTTPYPRSRQYSNPDTNFIGTSQPSGTPSANSATKIVSLAASLASVDSPEPAANGRLTTLSDPIRVFDSRYGVGGPGTPFSGVREVALTSASIPPGVNAALINITVVPQNGNNGYIQVADDPSDIVGTYPSFLNFSGSTISSAGIVRTSAHKSIYINSSQSVHVIVDIQGYFGVGSQYFHPREVAPSQKQVRIGTFAASSSAVSVLVANHCSSGTGTAQSALVNLTVANPGSAGWVHASNRSTSYIGDWSNLNYTAGTVNANMALVDLSSTGYLYLKSSVSANVIVDLLGCFSTTSGKLYAPLLSPSRRLDTRVTGPSLGPNNTNRNRDVAMVTASSRHAMLNLTTVNYGSTVYFTVYNSSIGEPPTSALNARPWTTRNNFTVSMANASKQVRVRRSDVSSTSDIIVDEYGYFY